MIKSVMTLKIWISVLLTLLVTVFVPPLTVVAAFAGLGNLPGWLIFPYSTIAFCFAPVNTHAPNNPVMIYMDYAQCLLYGIILGRAWVKAILLKIALWVAVIHVVAIVVGAMVWQYISLL